jgi:C_GCAxxG_C_C family probable redox protein
MKQSAKEYGVEAESYFRRGYNCAQSTAVVFADDFAIDRGWMMKLTAAFGGGIGGLRTTCGAVSAMAVVAGLHMGGYPPDDIAAKTALYEIVQRMHADFVARHGSACCRELLERAGIKPEADPSGRSADYYDSRPCAGLVASAAEIIATTFHRP